MSHTPEAIAKMSAAATGRKASPETRAKMRAAHLGQKRSPETCAKISASKIGKPGHRPSDAGRARISAAHKGKPHSPEWRAKIGAGLAGNTNFAGHHLTDEHRARLSRSRLGNDGGKTAPVIGECAYCGDSAQTRDHVIPRGRPGWDDPGNQVPACWVCNTSKGGRTPAEWLAREQAKIRAGAAQLEQLQQKAARIERWISEHTT